MNDWTATMISSTASDHGAPRFRKEFRLDGGHGEIADATLLLTALGVCEATINGHPVSPDVLTPGWSSYEWRVRYAEHNVAALLEPTTVIAVTVGNGWYRGKLGWEGRKALYGDEIGVLAELRVRFADGHVQIVSTDTTWTSAPSATTSNDLYDGQSIDARFDDVTWRRAGGEGSGDSAARTLDFDRERLVPYIGPPIRRQESLEPISVFSSPSGKTIVDFGQNLVGWVRVQAVGKAGDVITLRHAEVLEHGELGTRPLRGAEATDRFTLSGGHDVFEPTLTFHGFRYAEVDGWPGGIEALRRSGGVSAVVIGSELRRTGYFESSDPLLDQLHRNAVWGMRGNFVDLPTDCPQRDERLGWTGDISAFAPSAMFLFDAADFLKDWLTDLAVEQSHNDGIVPMVVPDILKITDPDGLGAKDATAVWSDAAVWVPWAVWMATGDRAVLERQFGSMTAHTRRVRSLLSPSGLWDVGFQFGDWLDPDAPPSEPASAKADAGVVATICAYRTARLTMLAAIELGFESERAEFDRMAAELRSAFTQHYLLDGTIVSDCTTVYALAITADILDEADRDFAGARLAELVRTSGHRISTGFAGTPFITDALSATGHLDDAYALLLQTESPSWLYPVTMGATTIWERWDSMLPDGTINSGEMTSFNHYALGAVVDWLHRVVGGLAPLEPGYRRMLIAPRPGGGLEWARTALDTPHGTVSVLWRLDDGRLDVDVSVPEGTTAVLRLEGCDDEEITAGQHRRSVSHRMRP